MSSNSQHGSGTWSGDPTVSSRQIKTSDLSQIDNLESMSNEKQLTNSQLYLCAVVIGIFGGMVATVYYFVLETMMHGMWHTLPEIVEPYFPSWLGVGNYVWIATTVGGFFCWFSALFVWISWGDGSGS